MTWRNITLNQWNQITALEKQNLDDIERSARIIEIVFGIEDAMELTPEEFAKRVKELEFIKEQIPETKLLDAYNINGTKYILNGNVFEWTMSMLMDYRKAAQEDNLEGMFSCFMIPEGKKYNTDYDIEKAEEDMGDLPITDVMAISDFFAKGWRVCTTISIDYLKQLMMKTSTSKEKKQEIQKKLTTLEVLLQNMTF